MAKILEHPNKDDSTDEQMFKFAEGEVMLKTTDGSPLTLSKSVWLLESVKHYIMALSFEE
jgi:hypothetical protein